MNFLIPSPKKLVYEKLKETEKCYCKSNKMYRHCHLNENKKNHLVAYKVFSDTNAQKYKIKILSKTQRKNLGVDNPYIEKPTLNSINEIDVTMTDTSSFEE